ncbi:MULTISPECIES: class I SAM-dependent methyltransferase [unclassified Wenzhouxiangella]|uniref:class I SAM-dependent methyltransferase n=1 Tax=unclassified Wenzhouxiangella TaxID=2613841 RepID=UPI000E3270D0|nr:MULTISPECIES: class I SAM-dependent methyltransferase [unclassified Wenzhouxiangella]RFF27479.1 class I SAM-dependent methyltransferase [Wenzhouxiangella sp. 15181]RFP69659.1 class I SAM-dependent methyltransferase [Wenzhouxiangella sp. 15190]
MDEFQLLIDLHKNHQRQGPGGDEETAKAVDLACIDRERPLKIADIGCGTGASTLTLARLLDAEIVAVDFLQEFLDVLEEGAAREGLSDRITPLCREMEDLPFDSEAFDIIWSEGAIYNIGFQKGIVDWRRYLKPGGLLVASEVSWLTESRPSEIQAHWDSEYPEIDTPSAKIKQLEASGYSPVGYFALPEHCWTTNYYEPIQSDFEAFLERHGNSEEARAIVEAERHEIELYSRYKPYFSYGVYIARKLAGEDA